MKTLLKKILRGRETVRPSKCVTDFDKQFVVSVFE